MNHHTLMRIRADFINNTEEVELYYYKKVINNLVLEVERLLASDAAKQAIIESLRKY